MTKTAATAEGAGNRIAIIDILRGLVIVLMALDHIRDYTHASGYAFNALSTSDSTPLIYATRWITHLCAPTFVFLAGASARLQWLRGLRGRALALRLVSRGLWLVALELTLVGFAWSFSVPFLEFLQVIWAIGWSMVLLAGFVWLPAPVALLIGSAIIVASSALAQISPDRFGDYQTLWGVLYRGAVFLPSIETPLAFVAYPILPWFAVMAAGYGAGAIFVSPRRDLWLGMLGAGMIAAFLLLRCFNWYGDVRGWTPGDTAFATLGAFFDVSKNPPTLDFVLITLGIVLLLAPLLQRAPRWLGGFFAVFGAAPLMAYVAHIFIMHLYAIGVRLIAGAPIGAMTDTMRAFIFAPERFGDFSLHIGFVYLVWLAVIATLYPLCRWWRGVKAKRRDWWLSYL